GERERWTACGRARVGDEHGGAAQCDHVQRFSAGERQGFDALRLDRRIYAGRTVLDEGRLAAYADRFLHRAYRQRDVQTQPLAGIHGDSFTNILAEACTFYDDRVGTEGQTRYQVDPGRVRLRGGAQPCRCVGRRNCRVRYDGV